VQDKVVVIGLDGATFTILDPLLKRGLMPNIARLMDEGCRGVLTSTLPPMTAPAWASFMTGVNPGKHGLFNWRTRSQGTRETWVSSRDIKARKLWDILNDGGHRVGVMGVPLTYPPQPVNGFLVSGMLTPNKELEYTYPLSVKQEVEEITQGYLIDVDIEGTNRDLATTRGTESFLRELDEATGKRTRAAVHLWKRTRPTFMIVFYEMPDRIQHGLWRYADLSLELSSEADQLRRELVLNSFASLDRAIGEWVSLADSRTTIFLISDHGFCFQESRLYLNRWLAEKGFLRFKSNVLGAREGLRRALLRVKRFVPRPWVVHSRGLVDAASIDWQHTLAYAGMPTEYAIYINLEGGEPQGVVDQRETYHALCEDIRQELLELTDPRSGRKVIKRAFLREEIYEGPYVEAAPHILFQLEPGYLATHTSASGDFVQDVSSEGKGCHAMEGILVVAGPHVAEGRAIAEAHIVDLAPTILHIMGLPVPNGMDGRVLSELFTPAFQEGHPITFEEGESKEEVEFEERVYSPEEEAHIEERLRGLGYLE
jgi:predicted AlkP superfamily phosphohydrolase/phosphomutase